MREAKQRRERLVTSELNITRIYSPMLLHPNKPPKGVDAIIQASGPKDQHATNSQWENKQEHGKEPRYK